MFQRFLLLLALFPLLPSSAQAPRDAENSWLKCQVLDVSESGVGGVVYTHEFRWSDTRNTHRRFYVPNMRGYGVDDVVFLYAREGGTAKHRGTDYRTLVVLRVARDVSEIK